MISAAKVESLNAMLGRELGRNQYGEPIFSWAWSEDLFWPAMPTGRTVTVNREVEIPILGAGIEKIEIGEVKPEYRSDRQVRQTNKWYVVKWLSPEELIVGGLIGHGMGWQGGQKPSEAAMREHWNRLFPGADFPVKGWRVPTDAYLPRSPHDPSEPNEADTLHFIHCIREQTSMKFDDRLGDMLASEDQQKAADRREIEDEARDCFAAFLNPNPGKRGGFLSMPWSKADRAR